MPAQAHRPSQSPRTGGVVVVAQFLGALLVATALACSGGGSSTQTGPSITLALSPTSGSVAQGATIQFTATATGSSDFTGTVSFNVTGAPSGVTVTTGAPQQSGTTFTSTVTVTAGASATTGNATLTVTASGTGGLTSTRTFAVTVGSSGGGGSLQYVLDFSGCGAATPLWVASQDGSGPWTRVNGVNGVFTFTITGNKAGWAFTQVQSGLYITAVNWFTRADIPSGTPTTLCPIRKTNNVTLAGITVNDLVLLGLGNGQGTWSSGQLQTVTLNGVATGTHDLVGYRSTLLSQRPSATDRAYILRDLNVATGGSVGTIDFNGANAITPTAATMTVANSAGGDQLHFTLQYATGGTASCTVGVMSNAANAATSELMYGIPAASQRATDFHQLQVFATSSPTTESRIVTQSFHTFANHTVTLGPVLPTPTVTDLNLAAYRRLQGVGTIPTAYPTAVTLQYSNAAALKSVSIQASMNWVGGTTATLAMPDFTAVAGWDNSWMPPTGQQVNWTMFATRIDDILTTTLVPNCVEGSLFMGGYRKGTM